MIARVGDNRRRPDPTPAEIRQRCSQIQRGWDDETRAARLGGHIDVHWSIPVVSGNAPPLGAPDESQDIHDDEWG